jgi:hypothetical protein
MDIQSLLYGTNFILANWAIAYYSQSFSYYSQVVLTQYYIILSFMQ